MNETKYDELKYVVCSDGISTWKITKVVNEYGVRFDFYSAQVDKTYPMTFDDMKELSNTFTFIYSEKDFLLWCLKYAN